MQAVSAQADMPTRGSVVSPRGSRMQTAEPAMSQAELEQMQEMQAAMQPESVRACCPPHARWVWCHRDALLYTG